jgi:hypothetical protein
LQAPFTHLPLHTLPHAPQLFLSFFTFVQTSAPPPAGAHALKPPAQVHALALQTWPLSQRMPQPPQFAGLFVVFTHTGGSPHSSVFIGHTQLPP